MTSTRICARARSLCVLALVSALCGCGAAPTQDATGAELFAVYCVSCHGHEGAGDGPVAGQLTTRPADLRALAASNAGRFDEAVILSVVDGRRAVAVHGPREMPVWGARFVEERREDPMPMWRAMADARALVDFLRTIQEPPLPPR